MILLVSRPLAKPVTERPAPELPRAEAMLAVESALMNRSSLTSSPKARARVAQPAPDPSRARVYHANAGKERNACPSGHNSYRCGKHKRHILPQSLTDSCANNATLGFVGRFSRTVPTAQESRPTPVKVALSAHGSVIGRHRNLRRAGGVSPLFRGTEQWRYGQLRPPRNRGLTP